MVEEWPILGYIRESVKCKIPLAGGAKPGSVVNDAPLEAAGAVSVVAVVTTIAKDHLVLVALGLAMLAWSVIYGLPCACHRHTDRVPWRAD